MKWTYRKDLFLVQFYCIGASILARNDFGCETAQVERRYKKLQKLGLIDPLKKTASKISAIEIAAATKIAEEFDKGLAVYEAAMKPTAQIFMFPPSKSENKKAAN